MAAGNRLITRADLVRDFECSICLELLCDPVTMLCGHTLCRICLMRALNEKPQCPLCRHPCTIQACSHPASNVIVKILRRYFAFETDSRASEVQAERLNYKRRLPLYFSNTCDFPNGKTIRCIYESRYRMMVTQAMTTSREYVSVYAIDECPDQQQPGSCARVGCIIAIKSVRHDDDGSCYVKGRGVQLVRLSGIHEVDGGLGLLSAEINVIEDGSCCGDGVYELVEQCKVAVAAYQAIDSDWVDHVDGVMPNDASALSFWMAKLVAGPPRFQLLVLAQESLIARLKLTKGFIEERTRRLRDKNMTRALDLRLAAIGASLALSASLLCALLM